jgi:hypothetical protein
MTCAVSINVIDCKQLRVNYVTTWAVTLAAVMLYDLLFWLSTSLQITSSYFRISPSSFLGLSADFIYPGAELGV